MNMPYDPEDIYTAEPKLLSLSCFPTLFTPVPPPDYNLIMASNTRYHRVPEQSRLSMESVAVDPEIDVEGLLLLDPVGSDVDDEHDATPKHKFTCHPTAITRIISVLLFIPSLIVLIVANRRRNTSAIIFVAIAIARNILVIFHHIVSRHIHIRIRIEFRDVPIRGRSPRRSCPSWLEQGPAHVLLDLILIGVVLVTTIIATQGSYGWGRYSYNNVVVAGCILAYIGE
jgi:hypothetical protein